MGKRSRAFLQEINPINKVSLEEQLSILTEKFCKLETLLLSYKSKGVAQKWENIQQSFSSMMSAEISLDDVCLMVYLLPGIYDFKWLNSSTNNNNESTKNEYSLFIETNIVDDCPHREITLTKRMNNFRSSVETFLKLNNIEPLCPDKSLIPECPDRKTLVVSGGKEKSALSFSTSHIKKSEDLFKATDQDSDNSLNTLDSLRRDVLARAAVLQSQAEQEKLEEGKQMHKRFLKSLPTVCDSLRSMFLARNTSALAATDCYKNLMKEKRCDLSTAKNAVLHLATNVVPEFFTIVPADDLLPYTTVKINLQCHYKDMRAKVLTYVLNSVDE